MHTIEWAAGLFEGEGTAYIATGKYPRCRLKMTDEDVVLKFQEVMGCGTVHQYKGDCFSKPHHKTAWYWQIGSKKDVRNCLSNMLPYLGSRRAHKALDILDYIECN